MDHFAGGRGIAVVAGRAWFGPAGTKVVGIAHPVAVAVLEGAGTTAIGLDHIVSCTRIAVVARIADIQLQAGAIISDRRIDDTQPGGAGCRTVERFRHPLTYAFDDQHNGAGVRKAGPVDDLLDNGGQIGCGLIGAGIAHHQPVGWRPGHRGSGLWAVSDITVRVDEGDRIVAVLAVDGQVAGVDIRVFIDGKTQRGAGNDRALRNVQVQEAHADHLGARVEHEFEVGAAEADVARLGLLDIVARSGYGRTGLYRAGRAASAGTVGLDGFAAGLRIAIVARRARFGAAGTKIVGIAHAVAVAILEGAGTVTVSLDHIVDRAGIAVVARIADIELQDRAIIQGTAAIGLNRFAGSSGIAVVAGHARFGASRADIQHITGAVAVAILKSPGTAAIGQDHIVGRAGIAVVARIADIGKEQGTIEDRRIQIVFHTDLRRKGSRSVRGFGDSPPNSIDDNADRTILGITGSSDDLLNDRGNIRRLLSRAGIADVLPDRGRPIDHRRGSRPGRHISVRGGEGGGIVRIFPVNIQDTGIVKPSLISRKLDISIGNIGVLRDIESGKAQTDGLQARIVDQFQVWADQGNGPARIFLCIITAGIDLRAGRDQARKDLYGNGGLRIAVIVPGNGGQIVDTIGWDGPWLGIGEGIVGTDQLPINREGHEVDRSVRIGSRCIDGNGLRRRVVGAI